MCGVTMLLANTLCAQDKDWYDTVAAHYKHEHAVVTNYTRRMEITEREGKLEANSYFILEKLIVSDLAPGTYNQDDIYSSHFNELSDLHAVASIPSESGYKKVQCTNFASISPDKDNVFYDDAREIVVSYSDLLKNAITETRYAIAHSDLHLLPPFYFQGNIPFVKASFEIIAPKHVHISFVLKGENTSWIKQVKEEKENTIVYRFTAENVPHAKVFDDAPSPAYYVPHVIPYITSYKLADVKKPEEMLSSPRELYKYMYKYIRNINMKRDTFIDNRVAELTANDKTQRQKAAHIYKWVQNNMHYVAFEAGLEGFMPRDASVVCTRKYGDCKDMTSVLVTMCRRAGLDAHYVWIGTREKPYFMDETPIPMAMNHMICAVKLGDEWVFMDGTHPLIPFGKNPQGIQGKEAMIAIDEDNYKIVNIPVTAAEKNVTSDVALISMSENKITGSFVQEYSGYRAWDLSAMMMYNKGDDRDKAIKALTQRGTDKYRQTSYDVNVSDTGDKAIAINGIFEIDDYVHRAGKEYYINMNLKKTFADKHIDSKDRTVAYHYPCKEKTSEVVVMEIPKGFRVTHLPAPAKGGVDGLWGYSISYKTDKKTITLTKEYELNTLTAGPRLFDANNKMVDDLKKIYRETVVLTADKNVFSKEVASVHATKK